MRGLLLIAIAALLAPGYAAAQRGGGRGGRGANQRPAPDMPGLACFDNLKAPEYPAAAIRENVDGTVWTTIQVNAQGAPEKVDTNVVSAYSQGSRLLAPAVEKAIHAATIKSSCAGKTIEVAFRYVVSGYPIANPPVTSRVDGEHVMWIESQPPLHETATSHSTHAAKGTHGE